METAQVRLTLGVCSRPWKADEAAATQLNITHSELPTTEQLATQNSVNRKDWPKHCALHHARHSFAQANTHRGKRTDAHTDTNRRRTPKQPESATDTRTHTNTGKLVLLPEYGLHTSFRRDHERGRESGASLQCASCHSKRLLFSVKTSAGLSFPIIGHLPSRYRGIPVVNLLTRYIGAHMHKSTLLFANIPSSSATS